MMVGHTHEDVDAFFSALMDQLRTKTILTPKGMIAEINKMLFQSDTADGYHSKHRTGEFRFNCSSGCMSVSQSIILFHCQ